MYWSERWKKSVGREEYIQGEKGRRREVGGNGGDEKVMIRKQKIEWRKVSRGKEVRMTRGDKERRGGREEKRREVESRAQAW